MTLDETLLSYLGGINNNDLINNLDTNLIDNYEPQLIRRSSYYDSDKFTKLTQISLERNCKNSLIIAGDFNINLLKLNENDMYSSYFDALISHSLFRQITFPTRFTRTNGTLIDNFFCKLSQSMLESTAGILIKKLSDHQPYFMLINTSLKPT